jgi:hypothetical protein
VPYPSHPTVPDFQDLVRRCYADPRDMRQFQSVCNDLRPYLGATLAYFTNDWSSINLACDSTFEYLGTQVHQSRFDPAVNYETYLIAVALHQLVIGQAYPWSKSPVRLVLGSSGHGSLTLEDANTLLFAVIWQLDGGCTEKLLGWIVSQMKLPISQGFGVSSEEQDLTRCKERAKRWMEQALA